MLTKAGLATIFASVTILAMARMFGLSELFIIGAAGLIAVALSIIYVVLRRLRVDVSRQLTPSRVHAGNPCRVDLTLRNRARMPTPVLRLRDDVSGTQGVELLIPPMRTGRGTQAVYRLPTERRGIVQIGPLRLTVADPFGLARLTTTGDREMSLVVYPRVDDLSAPRRTSGNDIERHTLLQHQVAPMGDEFYALREYVVGDDLRRVHWPSSARHDDLMVRQDEVPWHGRLTVLLDTRAGPEPATFERMVSAAASIASASNRRGDQVRLITSGGDHLPYGSGPFHLDRILEMLALVEQGTQLAASALEQLTSADSSGSISSITANGAEFDRGLLHSAASTYRRRVLVLFTNPGATPTVASGPVRSTTVVLVPANEAFLHVWTRAVGGPVRTGP